MRSGTLFYAYLPNLLIISILCVLPLYALCRAVFEPYFGSHKIRNSLMLKNMQKKFSGSHPLRQPVARVPLYPFANCWFSGSYACNTSVLQACETAKSENPWNIPMFHTCGTFRGTFYIVHYITNTLWNILMFYNRGTSWNIHRWWFFLPVVVIPGAASPANLRPQETRNPANTRAYHLGPAPIKKIAIFL